MQKSLVHEHRDTISRVICKIEGRSVLLPSLGHYVFSAWPVGVQGEAADFADDVNCVEIFHWRSSDEAAGLPLSRYRWNSSPGPWQGGKRNLSSLLRYHFKHVCDRLPYTSIYNRPRGYVPTYSLLPRPIPQRISWKCICFYLSTRPDTTFHNETPVNLSPRGYSTSLFLLSSFSPLPVISTADSWWKCTVYSQKIRVIVEETTFVAIRNNWANCEH